MNNIRFALAALSSFAAMGDILSDACESSAAVAGVENLKVLATRLSAEAEFLFVPGVLLADGGDECRGQICLDGRVSLVSRPTFDTSGRHWTFKTDTGEVIPVTMFVTGDCSDDEAWVVEDADAFYTLVLKA